jgi:hypothetical protein
MKLFGSDHGLSYRHRGGSLVGAVCVLLCTCLLQPQVRAAEEDLPTINEIIEGFRTWRQRIVTLDLEYEQSWPKAPEVTTSIRYHLLLTDQANFAYTTDELKAGELVARRIAGADSGTRFEATLSPEGGDLVVRSVHSYPRHNMNLIPQAFFPLYFSIRAATGEWMDELLTKVGGTVEGIEMIGETRCVVVRIPCVYEKDREAGAGDRVWLDIERNFFVRRAREIEVPGSSYRGFRYDCHEMQQLHPDLHFPLSGTFGYHADTDATHWKVTRVVLNAPLPDSLFAPPVKPRAAPKRSSSSQRHVAGVQLPATGPPPPVASRPAVSWILPTLVLISGLLLISAILLRRLQARSG